MEGTIEAPFGVIQVTVDTKGRVMSVRLDPEGPDLPEQGLRGLPDPVHGAFEAYLERERARPAVVVGDVDGSAFQHRVWEELARIEPGHPVTYGQLAERIGKPGAARAVGQALGANPLPLVWPCHRVVASDGLGGFGGCAQGSGEEALAIKRWLLAHERELAGLSREQGSYGRVG